jgi:peptidoglycan hydrolase FlgJ
MMTDFALAQALARPSGPPAPPRDAGLRAAAEALEASFLDEMLKGAGLGQARDAFGGGVGEEQFSSFLRQEQSKALAARGGIGLADSIYAALARQAS